MKTIQKILSTIGILTVLYAVITGIIANFSDSNYFFMAVGLFLLLIAVFFKSVKEFTSHGWGKVLKMIFFVGLFFIVLSLAICLFMIENTAAKAVPQPGRDAVIVLGAGLKGKDVSLTLGYRLDVAYEYAVENPDTILIMSGGQGPNELVTEASAMQQYLIRKGLDPSRIVLEDQSSSTRENMLFSKEILDKYFHGNDYTVVIATNGFHMLRSLLYARDAGFNAEGLAGSASISQLPNCYIREYFALLRYILIKR